MTWFTHNKVLVPVDFSDESMAAVEVGLQLVETPSRLIVVHVLQELSPSDPSEMWRTVDKDARRRHAAQALRDRLADKNVSGVRIDILFGDAGQEIAELAEREKAGLIVLPSHGRTGVKRLLIGSVAERVVRLAHCPVLVLRS